jgi:hypothetical protein
LRRRAAYVALLLGVGIHIVGRALIQPIIAATGIAPVSNPSLLAAVVMPIILPLLLALAAWSGSRTQSDATTIR